MLCRHLTAIAKQLPFSRFFGIIPVKLGDLGEGTKEATIKQWFVKEGENVKEFQDLCEVITDKLTAKIPSTKEGKVTKLNYKINEICQVGNALLDMDVAGEGATAQPTQSAPKAEEKSPSKPEPPKTSGGSSFMVKLGDLGEGTKEATIKQWFVKEGQAVKEFEDLCEVITDKLTAKIPSTHAGIVKKIYHNSNEICQVGSPLLEMIIEGGAAQVQEVAKHEEKQPEVEHKHPKKEVAAQQQAKAVNVVKGINKDVKATPSIRALAKKIGISLEDILGTGKNGRIMESDLLGLAAAPSLEGHTEIPESVRISPAARRLIGLNSMNYKNIPPTGIKGMITKEDVLNALENPTRKHIETSAVQEQIIFPSASPIVLAPLASGDKLVKLVGIRRAMVKSMTEIKKVPALNLHDDICIEELKKLRALYLRLFPKEKITMLPFLIKAFSLALLDYPTVNAHVGTALDSQGYLADYTLKTDHNISLAMDTPDGLIVPNIKSVQKKSILEINADLKTLVDKTKKGKVTKDDLNNGTFTISNIGSIGTKAATALLFRPQTGIAAICQNRLEPKFDLMADGKYKVTPVEVFTLCCTFDHRIIDGATAASFNKRAKQLIENPELMSLYLK